MASAIVWQRQRDLVRFPQTIDAPATADRSGNLSCLGLVPAEASGVILTVECGYLKIPRSEQAVELRIMPFGFNLERMLDIHKHSAMAGGCIPSIDVTAMQVIVPFHAFPDIPNPGLRFFYALMSTDSKVENKMMIIDCWGYTIER